MPLICNIYRLKELGILWNQNVGTFFESFDFVILNADSNILIHQKNGRDIIIINVYINDFLLISKNQRLIN